MTDKINLFCAERILCLCAQKGRVDWLDIMQWRKRNYGSFSCDDICKAWNYLVDEKMVI